MKIINSICITLLLVLYSLTGYSTHMVGGEISYTCMPNGNKNRFFIEFNIYQDCKDGVTDIMMFDSPLFFAIFENTPSPIFVHSGTISNPSDSSIVPPEFSNDCVSNYPVICLRELTFKTFVDLSPSNYGYTIVYQRCCRNFSILNILSPGSIGVTYSSIIPPFDVGNCTNNSPKFKYDPPQIICTNFPFSYDFSVEESDGDSLAYKLCPSYLGANEVISKPSGMQITPPPFSIAPYSLGFTYENPLPGFPPIYVNPNTGIVSFYPSAPGRFQINICVDEYRDGVLLNTHTRDLQILVTNCQKNVVADIPIYSSFPNTYMVNCIDFSITFENNSIGGTTYRWDFGDGSEGSTNFQPTHIYNDTGTYLVTLFVNEGTTCSDSISRWVKIYPVFTAEFTTEGKLCPGETIQFTQNIYSSLGNDYTYSWDFGDGTISKELNPTHIYYTDGLYTVKLIAESSLGCQSIFSKNINIKAFEPNAGNDTIIVLGYNFNLNGSGGENYQWIPGSFLSDPFSPNPTTSFPDTGLYKYRLLVGTEEGCQGEDSINILVVKDPSILMPNAFSPNGDGMNDEFKPKIIGYPFVESFKIFNRYGELVYNSIATNKGWNGTYKGKPADIGVYYYELRVRELNGNFQTLKGDVTLIR